MLSKYSVGVIVRGQIDTMRHYGRKEFDKFEIFLIFVFPLVSPITQFFLGLHLSESTVGTIVSAASIFAGLLLNLLVLLYSILGASGGGDVHQAGVEVQKERELIEQTFCNISFSIVICAALVIASLITLTGKGWWVHPAEFVAYYLGLQLFFLVAQILKRFHRLLEQKMSLKISKKNAAADDLWRPKK